MLTIRGSNIKIKYMNDLRDEAFDVVEFTFGNGIYTADNVVEYLNGDHERVRAVDEGGRSFALCRCGEKLCVCDAEGNVNLRVWLTHKLLCNVVQ